MSKIKSKTCKATTVSFFSELRNKITAISLDQKYTQRRVQLPILKEVASRYKLSPDLTEFINLGVLAHGHHAHAKDYKKSAKFTEMKAKWLRCFHRERCRVCKGLTPITKNHRLFDARQQGWCSSKCRNQDEGVRERNRQGVLRLMQNPKRKAKWIRKQQETSMRLHGTLHQNQTKEARARIGLAAQNTGYMKFRRKDLSIRGTNWTGLQGYEPQAIKYLVEVKGKQPSTIAAGDAIKVAFKYAYEGTYRTYHPDFAVGRTFVEVKSAWTLKFEREKTRAKLRAVRDAGYDVALMVMNNDGSLRLGKTWRSAKSRCIPKAKEFIYLNA